MTTMQQMGDDIERLKNEVHELRTDMRQGFETIHTQLTPLTDLARVAPELSAMAEAWNAGNGALKTARMFGAVVKWTSGVLVACGIVWALIKGIPKL